MKQETAHVKTFTFDTSFGALPGQFLMVWLPGFDEVPMSIAMDDGEQTKITFFDVGDMTKKLFTLREGDLVGLRGPFGTFYEWEKNQHLILVAGGYGAAPMYFVAKEALKDGCTVDFVVGARGKEHLLYLDEIGTLKKTTLHVATDDGSVGHKGYNTEVLEQLLKSNVSPRAESRGESMVFACGPELMLKRVSELCIKHQVPCSLSLERYMKCGFGICGNCTVDPLGIRLCCEGPVVKNELCAKIADFGQYHRDSVGRKHSFENPSKKDS
ncbi:dihydroorotate dehydrogenase electron transfer subunit [Candidatus Peribacteria bacterium RIFCSPHIGHO2_01_FULL_51_9]|nr:MAG: dihydroorotate dehydrogenase electron transfer subunit [Candidatus Peribacteria bacterium RIFCSPHIGHO2_01_FULL_51_9]